MNRVFVDMDGVLVDFDAYRKEQGLTVDEVKRKPGAYLAMPPIPGALQAVRNLIAMGFEVWIATKPPTGVAHAYSDKAEWVFKHLPELTRRIIITHDKGLLGDEGDFLCDDLPHKANCQSFKGEVLAFVGGYHWPQAIEYLLANIPCIDSSGAPGGRHLPTSVRDCEVVGEHRQHGVIYGTIIKVEAERAERKAVAAERERNERLRAELRRVQDFIDQTPDLFEALGPLQFEAASELRR